MKLEAKSVRCSICPSVVYAAAGPLQPLGALHAVRRGLLRAAFSPAWRKAPSLAGSLRGEFLLVNPDNSPGEITSLFGH